MTVIRTALMFVVALAVAAAMSMMLPLKAAWAAEGFHIADGRLVDANGTPFIVRGTNHMYAWYPEQVGTFPDVKRLGANTLRVVLSGGRSHVDGVDVVANVVDLCKRNRLICILDDHDTSGYLVTQDQWTLDRAADYWISVKDAVLGQEDYILINIGNEPYGEINVQDWVPATTAAIRKLRDAGFNHTLVVDAPDYGQDKQFVMRDNAPAVLANDPNQNILFSVHMYGAFVHPDQINAYLDSYQSRGLPLLVGEFGDYSPDENLLVKSDADTIMAEATRRGIGYLGWCWSGNSKTGLSPHLDQAVGFDPNRLTDWGDKLFNGPNGISATSAQATVFPGS